MADYRLYSGETRVASDSEFGDFTTLLVICPDDSTGIELNPQPTAPLPREGFGMRTRHGFESTDSENPQAPTSSQNPLAGAGLLVGSLVLFGWNHPDGLQVKW